MCLRARQQPERVSTMRVDVFVLLSLGLLAAPTRAQSPDRRSTSLKHGPIRELRRRSINITDETASSLQEIHIAGRNPTTLAFQDAIKPESILISDSTGALPERVRATD